MALTKVIGAGLGTLTEDQVLGGATPTLTIGDAGAEDAKIIFDGNAQDYHIGLDDSADSLTIGLGSALGTTTHMKFHSSGVITKPLQPAFLVEPTNAQSNVANNTNIDFGTERFDLSSDFATNTFTASVTGKYQLQFCIRIAELDSAYNWCRFELVTSNRTYFCNMIDPDFGQDAAYWHFTFATLADMDESDTAHIRWQQNGGSNQIDVSNSSYFSGYLVA